MQINEKSSIIEAILFASGEPIDEEKLAFASGVEIESISKLVKLLSDRYEKNKSSIRILKLGDSYQMSTKAEYAPYIKLALESKRTTTLSPAALEVLTIIAYNQPVTKAFVEHVRGIDSASVVNSLVEKDLLEEAGRLDVPGRPISYKTTSTFLRCFKFSSIDELPPLPSHKEQLSFDDVEEEPRALVLT